MQKIQLIIWNKKELCPLETKWGKRKLKFEFLAIFIVCSYAWLPQLSLRKKHPAPASFPPYFHSVPCVLQKWFFYCFCQHIFPQNADVLKLRHNCSYAHLWAEHLSVAIGAAILVFQGCPCWDAAIDRLIHWYGRTSCCSCPYTASSLHCCLVLTVGQTDDNSRQNQLHIILPSDIKVSLSKESTSFLLSRSLINSCGSRKWWNKGTYQHPSAMRSFSYHK